MSTHARWASAVTITDHIDLLEAEGRRFEAVASGAALDAPVPNCPGWDLDRLVRHLGDVHRWAALIVRDRVQERIRRDFEAPADAHALLAWYVDGLGVLLDVLRAASPDDHFWSWAPAPSPLAFWARRQAHETAIHRLDAEQATGAPTPFEMAAATDGIDEWLLVVARRVRVPDGDHRTLHLAAADADRAWLVELRDDGLVVTPGGSGGDCRVRAPAGELFALVTNRRDAAGLDVSGDRDLLASWRRSVRF